jgi:hypothetical protein
MNDMLLDDVNSLLDGDFGDDRILKQIARACKNNEVISNYERNYVQKLAEQYLGKKPPIDPSTISENPPTIPDIVIPPIDPSPQIQIDPSPQTNQSFSFSSSNSGLKNPKLILGFGSVALVIIVAAAILFSSSSNSFPSNSISDVEIQLSVQTDLSSYVQKDIISINGICNNSEVVNLSITNGNNDLIWAEQLSVKNNNVYSTLTIAGGSGWENSGTYTVTVDSGYEIKSIAFSFTS